MMHSNVQHCSHFTVRLTKVIYVNEMWILTGMVSFSLMIAAHQQSTIATTKPSSSAKLSKRNQQYH
jgi:hypothetical protein